MNTQNLTLALPKVLIKQIKILAAQEDKSITQMIRAMLEKKITKDPAYEEAKKRYFKITKKGFNLGANGHLNISREELHERR